MGIFLVLTLLFQTAAGRQIDLTVRDAQGLAVDGARVIVTPAAGGARKTVTSSAERAKVEGLAAEQYSVRIEADGFAAQTLSADLRNQTTASLEVRLEVARLDQEIVVAASRTEQVVGDIPASVTLVRSEDLKRSPAVVADDVLRQVPTFSLFRRTSSLASHPTAQGVSLRGVGPSGAGRTLVLIDNIPFNDPFGGWVYWTRVPLASVDKVEIVDGANSSVYGNYALGGVINILTKPAEGPTLRVRPSYGSRDTKKLDFFAADAWEKFGIAAEGSVFDTKGYFAVPEVDGVPLRGPVDTKFAVQYQNFNLKTDYTLSDKVSVFARGGYFAEDRDNGKVCTSAFAPCTEDNDTLWKYVSGGARVRLPDDSDLQARVWGNFERFHSTFLAVTNPTGPRSGGRLTLMQGVPTKDTGGMVQWSKALGRKNYFMIGTDWRWVDGNSVEAATNAANGGSIVTQRISGGTQRSFGVFLQDIISVTPKFQVTLSARLDNWKNYDAHNLETTVATGLPTVNNRESCNNVPANTPCLADKENTVGSPRIAARYHVSDKVSVWGGLSWGFRAPTLNELYRQFSIGAIVTRPNSQLGPERLTGGEGGINMTPATNLTVRSTWFVNKFTNPVSNVTLDATNRQRQNLGRTRIWGLQTDVNYRLSYWRFSAAYLYDIAKVKEFAADRSLENKFLAEVPMHRGSAELAYLNPKYLNASISTQFVGGQYDNDVNDLWLPYYGTVDISFSKKITRYTEATFGVQNLFDRRFYVQRAPTTLGAPRMVVGGLELSWNAR